MYSNFFGFKERPFQLVPNPDYLFLSRSHEEAIAHLNYAVSNGDGFVELTGEVGTGKTTLCRIFLDDLDKDSEVAYIFNPRLSSIELLRTINDEFGISSDADNEKELIDILNAFLMEKKSRKKNAILLIDEAQNLDKEVLEQLRLLSNLETNTSKLLQIILVGQPELGDMLDSYQLRQLRQRITLSWYLTPLSRKETREYIRHRVNIAAKKTGDVFTGSAYRMIYNYSRGIPRLINIACDRALLTAYGFNRRKVTGSIAANSIKELKAGGTPAHRVFTKGRMLTAFLALCCLVLIAGFIFKVPSSVFSRPPVPSHVEPAGKTGPVTKKPVKEISATFEDFLGNLSYPSSRFFALKTALSLWETTPVPNRYLNNMEDDAGFFQLAAAQNNFQLLQVGGDLELVKKLNLPAVLELLPPGAFSPRYLTLINITGEKIVLKGGEKEETITAEAAKIKSCRSGTAYILWKDFFNFRGNIPADASKESVFTLKMVLRDIGFNQVTLDYIYDDPAVAAVKKIQEKHGITVDGIVGSKTKIVIYNEKKELKIPHISRSTKN
ncbi:MAG: AAA family ATPase [bacterium]|nr:AAA family ATPase [bacterium]